MTASSKPVLGYFWSEKIGSDLFDERHWFFPKWTRLSIFLKAHPPFKADNFSKKVDAHKSYIISIHYIQKVSQIWKRVIHLLLLFLLLSRFKHCLKRRSFVLSWLQKSNDKGYSCQCVAETAVTMLTGVRKYDFW